MTAHDGERQPGPLLLAYRSERGSHLSVWCDHDERWHHHRSGGPSRGDGNGHRAAHCSCTGSPYLATGYELYEVGLLTGAVKAQHGRERPEHAHRCPTREPAWRDGRGGRP